MPFTAFARLLDSNGEFEIVDITRLTNPRLELAGQELRCPECQHGMHVVNSLGRVAHFRHNPYAPDECALRLGESLAHIYAKLEMCAALEDSLIYEGATLIKEHWLPDVRRRADLFVRHIDGALEVHETQLAAITIDELEERTKDYERAGIDTIVWWFGNHADTQQNRLWAKERLDGYGLIRLTESQERVL